MPGPSAILAIVDLIAVPLIAVALSMDCLAVAIAGSISMPGVSHRQILRVALAFGLFQFGMLVGGWYAGQTVVETVEAYDHWIAFGLLLLVGAHMLWEAIRGEEEGRKRTDITRGIPLLTLVHSHQHRLAGRWPEPGLRGVQGMARRPHSGQRLFPHHRRRFLHGQKGRRLAGALGRCRRRAGPHSYRGKDSHNAPLLIATTNAINIM